MRNVIAIVRLTSTPIRPAVSGSWAVARIARPWRVVRTNQVRTSSSGIVTIATKICWMLIVIPSMPKIDRQFQVPKMLSMLLLAGPARSRADVLEDEAHADRGDQRGELGGVAQRLVGDALDADVEAGSDQHRDARRTSRMTPILNRTGVSARSAR